MLVIVNDGAVSGSILFFVVKERPPVLTAIMALILKDNTLIG